MQLNAQGIKDVAVKHGARVEDVAAAVEQIVEGLNVPAHVALAALDAMEMLPRWPLFEATPSGATAT